MKLWRKVEERAAKAVTETPHEGWLVVDWPSVPADRLWSYMHEALLHCGWAMEQYQASHDDVYLNECDLGIEQFQAALAEKKRRV